MTEKEFLNQTKKWLSHKILLSNGSTWYKQPKIKSALIHAKDKFAGLLYNQQNNVLEIALKVKKNEGLLEMLLPIPQNPSYQNSLIILQNLIQYSEQILKQHNIIL